MIKNRLLRWRATWNPDMYHGWGRESRYFEGWYCKIVDPAEDHVFAVIPGISRGIDNQHHAFIQVLDGKKCKATYHDFSLSDFSADTREFRISLGGNEFSGDHIRLDLPELKGEIQCRNRVRWPKMLGAPGIMGWYSFVPFMECYHGVVSLHHQYSGQLKVYGKEVDFTGGTGYMEKDWGVSFPRSWIWMQSNHFGNGDQTCVMASVAHIPWIGSYFIGYIVGFQWQNRLYRFATYTGARMKAALSDHDVTLAFADHRYRLEITGVQAPGAKLVSPLSGNMTGKVNESMQGVLRLRFYEKDRLLYEGQGRNAGLEIAGDVQELLTAKWRR